MNKADLILEQSKISYEDRMTSDLAAARWNELESTITFEGIRKLLEQLPPQESGRIKDEDQIVDYLDMLNTNYTPNSYWNESDRAKLVEIVRKMALSEITITKPEKIAWIDFETISEDHPHDYILSMSRVDDETGKLEIIHQKKRYGSLGTGPITPMTANEVAIQMKNFEDIIRIEKAGEQEND